MDEIAFTRLERWTTGYSEEQRAVGLLLVTTAGEEISLLLPPDAAEAMAESLALAAARVQSPRTRLDG